MATERKPERDVEAPTARHLEVAPPAYDWAERDIEQRPKRRRAKRIAIVLVLEALLLAAILGAALVPDVLRWTRTVAAPVVEPVGDALHAAVGDSDRSAAPPREQQRAERAQGQRGAHPVARRVRPSAVLAAEFAIVRASGDERLRSYTRVARAELTGLVADTRYQRLSSRAQTLTARIRALLRNGVTAAERARLLRLRIALARTQRLMLRRRMTLLRTAGVSAAERAQLARLGRAVTLVNKTILQRRIRLVVLGGVTAGEQQLLTRLRGSLERVERKLEPKKKPRRRAVVTSSWSHSWEEPEEEFDVDENGQEIPGTSRPVQQPARRAQPTQTVEETYEEEEIVEEPAPEEEPTP